MELTLAESNQKYLESFAMWCWRRMEKIRLIECVISEKVLHRVKEERNIIRTISRRKATPINQ